MLSCTIGLPIRATVIEETQLEKAIISVKYNRIIITDTINPSNGLKKDMLTLKAGKDQSAFYSADLKTQDSISVRNFDLVIQLLSDGESFKQYANKETEVVFKNYPPDVITVFQRFNSTNWIYTEKYETPEWEITSKDSVIMDYPCILAICKFRGRVWSAWFTPEIPISQGPWKLGGLPGLILKATDSRGHYSYEAVEIFIPQNEYVEYFNYDDRVKTNRIASLIERRRHLNDKTKNKIIMSDLYGISNNIVPNSELKKLNYDFEEIDYPHE